MTPPCHAQPCPRHYVYRGEGEPCGPLSPEDVAFSVRAAQGALATLAANGGERTEVLTVAFSRYVLALAAQLRARAEELTRLRASLGRGAPDYGHEER